MHITSLNLNFKEEKKSQCHFTLNIKQNGAKFSCVSQNTN
jgi:hypothetical protein